MSDDIQIADPIMIEEEEFVDVITPTLEGLKQLGPEELRDLGELMMRDSRYFVITCFPHIISEKWSAAKKKRFIRGELSMSQIFPEHHIKMYEMYDKWIRGEISYLCFVLFRKAAKTSLKRFIATKLIAYAMANVMMFVSETIQQAKEDVDTIKYYIETNPILKYLFNDMRGGIWNKEEAEFISQGKTIYIISRSMGSNMRGVNHRDHRVDFSFCDDFESIKNTLTETSRDAVRDKMQNEVMHIGDGNHSHRLLIQGTIPHPESYIAFARFDKRFNSKRGRFIEYGISDTPSVKYNYEFKKFDIAEPQFFEVGTPIWPETLNAEYIRDQLDIYIENHHGRDFWMVLQEWWNVPKQDSKALFDVNMIKEFDAVYKTKNGVNFIERVVDGKTKKIICDVKDGVDPASGRNDKTDNTVKVTVATIPTGQKIILDVYAGIIEFEEQVDMIIKSIIKYNPDISMIESVAYQYSLYSVVKKRAKEKKFRTIVRDFNTKKSKNAKYKEGLTTLVNSGNLYYIKGCRNIDILLKEFSHFNREDDKDDTLDGVYIAEVAQKDRVPKAVDVDKLLRVKGKKDDIYSRAIKAIEKRKSMNNQEWYQKFKESMR